MSEESEWQLKFNSLKQATKDAPGDGLAWLRFGDFLHQESESPSLAVRAYEHARDLLPDEDLRLRLGNAYIESGETEKGFALMRASAVERPRAEAFCFLADALTKNGRRREAEIASRQAIQLDPSFEEGYYLLGEALKDRDQPAAISAYRKAVSLDKDYALAWQALGRELANGGKTDEGLEALMNAVSLVPDDFWSRALLANLLWKVGRPKEAEEQYLHAISLAPDFREAQEWYREFLKAREIQK